MNIRRGLFRFWVLFACIFILIIAGTFFSEVKREFAFLDGLVKNPPPIGYVVDHPPDPWGFVLKLATVALGIPALVLGIGIALLWASDGFRRTDSN